MMKKHRCENCVDSTTFVDDKDYPWALERKYIVYARHIHTGVFAPSIATDDKKKADDYAEDTDKRCSSHEHFVVIENNPGGEIET